MDLGRRPDRHGSDDIRTRTRVSVTITFSLVVFRRFSVSGASRVDATKTRTEDFRETSRLLSSLDRWPATTDIKDAQLRGRFDLDALRGPATTDIKDPRVLRRFDLGPLHGPATTDIDSPHP